MGCYPLGKLISKALGKCNGRESRSRRRAVHTRTYSPPPTYIHTKSMARSVTFSNNNPVYIISSSDSGQDPVIPQHQPIQVQPEPIITGPTQTETLEAKDSVHVRFVPGPGPPAGSNRTEPPPAIPVHPGYNYRYVPSPLPRWEEPPRRREYFSGEYHYYPTPVREGIYNIATDANRLTAIFSEENPNACTIV